MTIVSRYIDQTSIVEASTILDLIDIINKKLEQGYRAKGSPMFKPLTNGSAIYDKTPTWIQILTYEVELRIKDEGEATERILSRSALP